MFWQAAEKMCVCVCVPACLQIAVPYDWRLPIPVMEKRDGFFTRVKHEVELQYQLQGIKPILVSHSYGAQVTVTFLHWIEEQEPGWVDKYLAGYVNLAGPLLGLPKAISPMLSGESSCIWVD
jgi:phospholipid:diacylglycerol acyltransferase